MKKTYPDIKPSDAVILAKMAALLRKAESEGQLLQTCSSRQIMEAAFFVSKGYSVQFATSNILIPNYISSGEEEIAAKLLSSF